MVLEAKTAVAIAGAMVGAGLAPAVCPGGDS